jgi:hypothetical protein
VPKRRADFGCTAFFLSTFAKEVEAYTRARSYEMILSFQPKSQTDHTVNLWKTSPVKK